MRVAPLPRLLFRLLVVSAVGLWIPLVIGASLIALRPAPAMAQVTDETFWLANGPVNALLQSGTTIYVGGEFTYVGPQNGSAAWMDATSGALATTYPRISGIPNFDVVSAVAPDGSGGWFIGGSLFAVGAGGGSYLTHILANGTVAAWNPRVAGPVRAIAVSGSTVYIGGAFTSVGGVARHHLAAVDATTGQVTAWNPGPSSSSEIRALAVIGSTVYVGGSFSSMGGTPRFNLAAVDPTTGILTPWIPNPPPGGVLTMQAAESTIYLGMMTTSTRPVVAYDVNTGARTSLNADTGGQAGSVHALALRGTTLYAGGVFSRLGGQPRQNLAALDATTGAAQPWNPGASGPVHSLAANQTTVWAGGEFASVAGLPRGRLASIDAATGSANPWGTNASSTVNVLSLDGPTLFAGGRFNSIGGQVRNRLAAIDVLSGAATAWDPNASGVVRALAKRGSTLYVGGDFDLVGGQARSRLAGIDAGTGAVTGWNPIGTGSIRAIALAGTKVYAGGEFYSIGGQSRDNLAQIDALTGAVGSWNPDPTGSVRTLAVLGSRILVGGAFGMITGQWRGNLAAVDTVGTLVDWHPTPNGYVNVLRVDRARVYVGGTFTFISGQYRNGLAALDTTLGTALSWDPNPNLANLVSYGIRAIAVSGSEVYVTGDFSRIGMSTRSGLAAVDAATGSALDWVADAGTAPEALLVIGPVVYAGGAFTSIATGDATYLAALPAFATVAVPPLESHSAISLASAPNPVRGRAVLSFVLPTSGVVNLSLYDPAGRKVTTLLDREALTVGRHDVPLDARLLKPGLYFARLSCGPQRTTRKLLVTR